ncbi:MAG: CHAT domain-containing protein [Saprospiraceae bacterium]|nr:CHAT domain-containing protein [Saprospiraceae bacterium]
MLIQLIEQSCEPGELKAVLRFETAGGSEEFAIAMPHPHDAKKEEDLEWYFEQYIEQPYTAESKVQRTVETQIIAYGTELFSAVFADPRAIQLFYDAINQEGYDSLTLEIVSREQAPGFQTVLWETLRDPNFASKPLIASGLKIVRRSEKQAPLRARVGNHPALNLLIVTARPSEENDVNYRTIQRPLIELLSRTEGISVNSVILRPGTYEALKNHLDEKGAGFYHIIHFDLHGEVLEFSALKTKKRKGETTFAAAHSFGNTPLSFQVRWGRYELEPFEGKKAFLFFESEKKGISEPATAEEIADLLREKQIPVCLLNACQSAKQEGDTSETSLGKYLHENGVAVVLAMRYSVSVSAASLLMERLYQQIFENTSLDTAVNLARVRLFDQKERDASLGYKIDLEDWVLPIIFQNQAVQFQFREFEAAEKKVLLTRQRRAEPFPKLKYSFKGRDLDILKIEKRLLPPQNHLLLRGMIGVGKSTLLRYLAAWWTVTNFRDAKSIVYLDLSKPLGFANLLETIAKKVFEPSDYRAWKKDALEFRAQALLNYLNGTPNGLILDNIFEWRDERAGAFFRDLNGKSFSVYGSVNPEEYLSPLTFQQNIYFLEGLDKNAAFDLAAEIVHQTTPHRWENLMKKHQYDLENLMELLAGFPSAMELVLPFLKDRSVPETLEAFNNGTLPIEW